MHLGNKGDSIQLHASKAFTVRIAGFNIGCCFAASGFIQLFESMLR